MVSHVSRCGGVAGCSRSGGGSGIPRIPSGGMRCNGQLSCRSNGTLPTHPGFRPGHGLGRPLVLRILPEPAENTAGTRRGPASQQPVMLDGQHPPSMRGHESPIAHLTSVFRARAGRPIPSGASESSSQRIKQFHRQEKPGLSAGS